MKPFFKLYCLFLFSFLFSLSASSQKYFELGDEIDTTATNFYGRNYNFTICPVVTFPDIYIGASALIHFNKERFSTFIDVKKNISNSDIVTGTDTTELSLRQKKVSYNSIIASIGLASSIKKYFLVYAAIGICYESTDIYENPDDGYYYKLYHDGMHLDLEIGSFYVSPQNLTFKAGLELQKGRFNIGIGYSF